jgi:hypothetical protein
MRNDAEKLEKILVDQAGAIVAWRDYLRDMAQAGRLRDLSDEMDLLASETQIKLGKMPSLNAAIAKWRAR